MEIDINSINHHPAYWSFSHFMTFLSFPGGDSNHVPRDETCRMHLPSTSVLVCLVSSIPFDHLERCYNLLRRQCVILQGKQSDYCQTVHPRHLHQVCKISWAQHVLIGCEVTGYDDAVVPTKAAVAPENQKRVMGYVLSHWNLDYLQMKLALFLTWAVETFSTLHCGCNFWDWVTATTAHRSKMLKARNMMKA